MDLRGWEKLEEDDSSVTLRHPKGHTMRIAVKALPRIQREQIKRLNFAEGGAVKAQKLLKKSRGQSVQGGYIEDDDMDKAKDSAELRAEKERKIKPKMKKLADGTPDGPVENDSQDDQQTQAPAGTTININAAQPQQPQAIPIPVQAKPVSAAPGANLSGGIEAPSVPMPAIPKGEPNLNPNGQVNPSAVSRNAQLANEAGAKINAAEAQGKEQLEGNYADAQIKLEQRNQQRLAEMNQHVQDADAWLTDPKNAVSPKHFGQSLDTTQKVGAAIGLFLGGLGTPFGGHNYAFDFLNKQIDRDIDAQKQMVDNHKTVLGAYQDLYGKGVAADNLTKATMLDVMNSRARQQAAQLGTPRAQQRLLELNNATAIEKAKALKEAGVDITALPGYGGQGKSIGNVAPEKMPDQGKNESGPKYQILAPDAEKKYKQIMAGYNPQWSPKSELINQQYTAAQQAEKLLNGPNGDGKGGIEDIMDQMQEAQGKMGAWGHLHGSVGDVLGAVPFVNAEKAAAAANVIPPTHSEKRFRALQSALETDLGTALQGIMTPTEIHSLVGKFSPAYQDDAKDISFKKEQVVNSIMKAIRSSGLHGAGMIK